MTMQKVFARPPTLKLNPTHYCPGCGHGIVHRLVAEAIDDLGIRERTIGIAPVGCAVLAYDYLDVDMVEVAHGRAPAVATGIKRVRPDRIVFCYQGDGDLASIGAAEILHATHRGEPLTVIFVNNAVYGMTGGQMAPTSVLQQVTATSPQGRRADREGYPMQVAELLAVLPGAGYVERVGVHSPAAVRTAKKAVVHAFERQVKCEPGLSLIEVLSPCPTYWRMTPAQALRWLQQTMCPVFPLGRLKG